MSWIDESPDNCPNCGNNEFRIVIYGHNHDMQSNRDPELECRKCETRIPIKQEDKLKPKFTLKGSHDIKVKDLTPKEAKKE